MALGPLRAFLRRHPRIALDIQVCSYQLEANARYLALTDQIFSWIERPGGKAVISTITMTELLVQPYRAADQQQADEFYVLLSTYPNLEWIAPNLEIADRAAKLLALRGLRTPDALHAATAVHAGTTGLVTNDPVFERMNDFETLLLGKFL